MQTVIYILPELFLSLSIMTLLMVGIFVKNSFRLVNLLTIFTLIFASALVLNQPDEIIKIFNGSYIIDKFSIFMKILTLLFSLFVFSASSIVLVRQFYCWKICNTFSNSSINSKCFKVDFSLVYLNTFYLQGNP